MDNDNNNKGNLKWEKLWMFNTMLLKGKGNWVGLGISRGWEVPDFQKWYWSEMPRFGGEIESLGNNEWMK